MSMAKRTPGPIPKRWLHCPRKSDRPIVDKFIALKTPLSADFDSAVPPECRFHPKMFFDICKSKRIKIGLWIDLTNTSRFYDKADVETYGCKYVKLPCRGHGETPSKEQTSLFIKLVSKFIAQNPLEKIAVHCTHGFNRTGFMIISYLVEKTDCSLDMALATFAEARPVGIYKQDYLQELYLRYEDTEDIPPAPHLPDWCIEEEDEDDGEHSRLNGGGVDEAASTSSSSQPPKKKLRKNINTEFMAGVPGVCWFDEQPKAHQLQKKIQTMCGWKKKGFPGCQPVSMSRENMILLKEKPYRVSWKADGTRYMMLIDGENEVYFFDRNNTVFKVEGLRFVHRKDLNRHLRNTLLDGEMVIDKVDGEEIPRYLAYDIIKFEGHNVDQMPFYPMRLQCLDMDIIRPRHAAMEQMLINKLTEPFSVRKKDFWPITQAANLLGEKFAKSLSHEPDGLIFQPSKEPYVAGRCDEVLKWKPLDMNSVDFLLRIVKEGGAGIIPRKMCHLYVGQQDTPYARTRYTKEMRDLDGKIIECSYDGNRWIFMRERTDKGHPNSVNTANAVCDSIRAPVTKEGLLQFIERFGFKDESESMPAPQGIPPVKKQRC